MQVAVFVYGLKNNSRIKMKLSGQEEPLNTYLLAGILDRLSFLVWAKTKDAQKGRNYPLMVMDTLMPQKPKNKDMDVVVFRSGEDFMRMRNELINKEGGG